MKKLWMMFPAMLLLAGLVLVGCGNDSTETPTTSEGGPPAIPADGSTSSLKWHRLTIDPTETEDDDEEGKTAEEITAENEEIGKGKITGTDFDAIVAATVDNEGKFYQGTYLRIYLDLTDTEAGTGVGWGIGALGNIMDNKGKPSGGDNLSIPAPAITGYAYVDLSLKALYGYYDEADEEINVNVWRGVKIRAILLFEPVPAVLEAELPDGVTEFTPPTDANNPGKGNLGTPDVAKLNAAKPGSILKLFMGGWPYAGGVGSIDDPSSGNWVKVLDINSPASAEADGSYEVEFSVAALKYAFGETDYDEQTSHATGTIPGLAFNLWGTTFISKIWLIEPDDGTDPPPPTVGNELDLFDGTDLISGATVTVGTFSGGVLKAAKGADSNANNKDGDTNTPWADYTLTLTFDTPIDLTEYTHLVVEFDGIHDDYNQIGGFLPGFNDNPKVIGQTGGTQSRTLTYELGDNLKDWGGSDDWANATPLEVLELYVNAIDVDGWKKLLSNDAEGKDMIITSIKLIELN